MKKQGKIYLFTILFLILWILWLNKLFAVKESKTQENINYSEAYFAWWCFWCMEWFFEWQSWVKEVISWYSWWDEKTANYKEISSWKTKHKEAVKVIYNPQIISYEKLVELFWTQIDPTNPNWQFADIWPQYKTAIFYKTNSEKEIATKSKENLEKSKKFDKKIVTEILKFNNFFPAEEYHQNYYKKQAKKYEKYKKWSWREDFIKENWNSVNYKNYDESLIKTSTWRILLFFHADWCSTCKALEKQILKWWLPSDLLILKVDFDSRKDVAKKYSILSQSSFVQIDNKWNMVKRIVWKADLKKVIESLLKKDEVLKNTLSPMSYEVTQMWWTEKPFENEYWDNHEEWIYVDVIDWTPLFSSTDKFDSWTWWPSFSKPIDENLVWEKNDNKLWMSRTEVVSWSSNSHLWHVFNDWPEKFWWLRYCINSAALKFIWVKDMKKMWYEKYLFLFEKK